MDDDVTSTETQLETAQRVLGITAKSTYLDTFVGLCISGFPLKGEIRQFLMQSKVAQYDKAPEALDAFLDDEDGKWHTHDPAIDEEWSSLIQKLEGLEPGLKSEELSKPSGPKKAAFGTLWHYPTFTTRKAKWGLTLDRSNPCINVQVQKIGMPQNVLTLDLHPTRTDYEKGKDEPSWGAIYKNWPLMDSALQEFAHTVTKDLRLLIAVGKKPADTAMQVLREDPAVLTQEVKLRVAPEGKNLKMWDYDPSFLLVRDARTRRIKKIIFSSFHGHWFLWRGREPYHKYGVWHDFLWNLVCECSGVPVKRETFFATYRTTTASEKTPEEAAEIAATAKARADKKAAKEAVREEAKAAKKVTEKAAWDHGINGDPFMVPRNVLDEKYTAFKGTYQYRRIMSLDDHEMSDKDKEAKADMARVEDMDRKALSDWLSHHAVFYSREYGLGLRYAGDGGPPQVGPDAYKDTDHPAVKLLGVWVNKQKAPFRTGELLPRRRAPVTRPVKLTKPDTKT